MSGYRFEFTPVSASSSAAGEGWVVDVGLGVGVGLGLFPTLVITRSEVPDAATATKRPSANAADFHSLSEAEV